MNANPGSQYMRKIFMILPITFIFSPIFYAFLGYHPDMPALFPVLVYFWHMLFVFLGTTLAFLIKKYKYTAYILILVISFFCRNIITIPWFNFQKAVLISVESGETIVTMMKIESRELIYYTYVLFVSTLISGACGVFYSKKEPLDFLSKDNTFLFCNILAISAVYYIFGGILETDKNSGLVFTIYLTGFAVSYFIVRNFAYINREIEVYGKTSAYNISGTGRIYSYYFSITTLLAVVPVFFGIILIPFVINTIKSIADFVVNRFLTAVLNSEGQTGEVPISADIPANNFTGMLDEQQTGDKMLAYYIIIAAVATIILVLIIIFRKKIIAAIKRLMAKVQSDSYRPGMVIEEEIITKAKKEKKSKSSYNNYLKKAKKIKDLRMKFLFAYSYIFWGTIKKDGELAINATPNELAEKYAETKAPSKLYQNIIYGQQPAESPEMLKQMTASAESFMREFL